VMDRGQHGWEISRYDSEFLVKSVDGRMAATGNTTTADYGGILAEDRAEAQIFLDSLNITHSEFFRNPLTYALIEQLLLPRLIAEKEGAGRAEIRVWSAACAEGQEAYSMAVLLNEVAAARGGAVSFRIFATDHSDRAVAAARKGLYTYAAVRNVRLAHLLDYFNQEGDLYAVHPKLRDRIAFSVYDLLDDRSMCPPASIYGDFDLVICSNLLFYYRQDIRQRILNKVHGSLSSSGYLVTGEVESAVVADMGGFSVVDPSAAVFRKIERRGGTT
jgi:chemotaxis protein methyltransferase CheR